MSGPEFLEGLGAGRAPTNFATLQREAERRHAEQVDGIARIPASPDGPYRGETFRSPMPNERTAHALEPGSWDTYSSPYDPAFFEAQRPVAERSARRVLPAVLEATGARSVVDVGCGVAAWAGVAVEHGCAAVGVDAHVPREEVAPGVELRRAYLGHGFDCEGFDLAICLEVAEHVEERASRAIVAGLCRAPFVLFGGAHPGQGGVDHVNEQWATWWARHFEACGYVGSSLIHWGPWGDDTVQDYYRENTVLYATPALLEHALEVLAGTAGVVDVLHPSRLRRSRWAT